MKKQGIQLNTPNLLAGMALGAGLALIASRRISQHPEQLPAQIRRERALNQALKRARQAATIPLQGEYRYVIFSDHHKGARMEADDFQPCEKTYLTALDWYNSEGYSLIILGDAEELWEQSMPPVMQAYGNVFASEARFYPNRYIRLSGNHDNAWEIESNVRQHLDAYFPSIRIHQQVILDFDDSLGTHGEIMLIHGNQGTLDADIFAFFPPLILPYFREIQNLTGIGHTSPSKDNCSRGIQDNQMYLWASKHSKFILIAGHTHRPIWGSATHLEKLIMQLHSLQHQEPRPTNYAQELARLQNEIQARMQKDAPCADMVKTRPCYFNTGCCSFEDGDITGIEIAQGEMRLIKWGSRKGEIVRTELENMELVEIFYLL